MKSVPTSQPLKPANRRTALVVFALSLVATFFAVWREHELTRSEQVIRWQDSYFQLQPVLQPFLFQRFFNLHSLARNLMQKHNDYSETAWQDFLKMSEWHQRFPGMSEIGYAELEGEKCIVQFSSTDSTVSTYPPGYDLNSSPVIREAVTKAAENTTAASTPIDTSNSTNAPQMALCLLTLEKEPIPPRSPAENRANTRGFIFFLIDQQQYFQFLHAQIRPLPFNLRLLKPDEISPPKTTEQRSFTNNGISGEWHFTASMKPAAAGGGISQWLALGLGLALSALLYFLFATQAQLHGDAELAKTESDKANEQLRAREAEITAFNRTLEETIATRTAELRDTNERLIRFKAVIETTTDFVGIGGLDGRVLYINQAGLRLAELSAEKSAEALTMAQLFPDVHLFFEKAAHAQTERDDFWAGETRLVTGPRDIPVSFVGTVIRSSDGTPLHLACIARDISERKHAEQELHRALAREQELGRLKGNFVSMVSHEIRTPLALILSSSEMLGAYFDRLPPEKRQRHLETISDAVQRMALLVDDVLLFSRAEAGRLEFKPAAIEINSFCTRLVDELASATHRRCPIQIILPPVVEPVHVDEFLLRYILTNLLTNAVKYSAPGSAVSLEAQHSPGLVIFSVRDQGIGISKADLEKIFTPFFRGENAGNTSGTGLGLVIVKLCVERHCGKIHVESHEGEGTLVTVELPVCVPGQTEFFLSQLKHNSGVS